MTVTQNSPKIRFFYIFGPFLDTQNFETGLGQCGRLQKEVQAFFLLVTAVFQLHGPIKPQK